MDVTSRESTEAFDRLFLLATAFLIIGGIVILASASMPLSMKEEGYPYEYVNKQLRAISLGSIGGLIVFLIPTQFWERLGIFLPLMALLLLASVFIPELGKTVNGSTRWLDIPGLPNIQVIDPARLLLMMYMAGYCFRQQENVKDNFMSFVKPMIFIIPACLLLLLQPDFGSTVIILSVAAGLFFLAGFKMRYFVSLILLLFSAFAVQIYIAPYRMARLSNFLEPWNDPLGAGYQLTNSLIAIGSGGLFGLGLGESLQKLFYLPEAHTDFIFAIFAEELGLVGTTMLLLLYGLLIYRIFAIGFMALNAKRVFQSYLCMAIGLWLAMQVIINLGVNMGMLPTKGLTLPLISYGSSSILMTLVTLAIVLKIGYENPRQKKNLRVNG